MKNTTTHIAALFGLLCSTSCVDKPARTNTEAANSRIETLATSEPATRESPNSEDDSMQFVQRVAGSTFIEILEVVATKERLLYCTGVRGLQIVNIDESTSGELSVDAELRSSKYSHDRFARCQHVAIEADTVYFTNRGDMIQKTPFITGFDLSQSPPKEIANYPLKKHSVEGIAVKQGLLYATMHERGLAILQPSGETLKEVGQVGGFTAAWAVAVDTDHAYVADASGFMGVVDISNTKKPKLIAKLEVEGSPQSIALSGKRVYIAAASGGLAVVDISDPKKPTIAHQIDTMGAALQVSISGNRAYVANWGDARVYDISGDGPPTNIAIEVVKTEADSSRVLGMSGIGDQVFVGEWTGMHNYRLYPDKRAPHISVGEIRIDFDRQSAGNESSTSLLVSNEGNAPLVLPNVGITGDGFSAIPLERNVVEPGQTIAIEIHFAPSSDKEHKGRLLLSSNDPDDGEITIPLVGNHKGLSVGDPAPEVSLSLINGGKWKLSDQRGKIVLLSYFATF